MSNILIVRESDSDWQELFFLLAEQHHNVYIAKGQDVVPLGLLTPDIGLVIIDRPGKWLEAQIHPGIRPPVAVVSNYYTVANNPYDGRVIKRILATSWGASEVHIFRSEFNPFEVAAAVKEMLMS